MSATSKKMEKQLMMLIGEVMIEDLENPAMQTATVTEVVMNKDKSIAKVYVNFFKDQKNLLNELKSAGKFIRKQVAARANLRHMPFLEFELDNLMDQINEMEKLIKENV